MATNTAIDGAGPTMMVSIIPGNPPSVFPAKNVSSVTRQSTGNYTINFTTSFANAHYVLGGIGQNATSPGGFVGVKPGTTPSTSAVQIQNLTNTGGLTDTGNVLTVLIFPI